MSVDRGAEAWWQIESARAAQRSARDRALRRLRSALRDLIEALVDDHPVPKASVSELNFLMQSAPASTRLALIAAGLRAETHWHREFGGNPRLAFTATQAAEFLSDPSQVHRLRWCANPACSVVFIAVNPGGALEAEPCPQVRRGRFYEGPGLFPPRGDRCLVPLGRPAGRHLHAPAYPVQQQIQPGQGVVRPVSTCMSRSCLAQQLAPVTHSHAHADS